MIIEIFDNFVSDIFIICDWNKKFLFSQTIQAKYEKKLFPVVNAVILINI